MNFSQDEGLARARLGGSEGLGGSLALYFAMMAGTLALFVMPIYWLNSAEVHANPGLAAYEAPRGTNVVPPAQREEGPLANLAPALAPDAALQAVAADNIRKLNGGRGVPRHQAETTGSASSERAERAAPRPAPTAMQMLNQRMSTVF